MKKMKLLTLLLGLTVLLFGCSAFNSMPTADEAQETFNENYAYIQTVVSYMVSEPYEKISVDDASGTMYADFAYRDIENSSVVEALTFLFNSAGYMHIYMSGNTIYFEQWRSVHERDCGVAYSINGIDEPDVQYMTECVPLAETGWYYCVVDYNLWRVEQDTKSE